MTPYTLTDPEKKILLRTARCAIESQLTRSSPRYQEPTPPLREKRGVFVSLHIHERLRGCIGYVTALKPLFEAVKEMAEAAALSDPRFPPLESAELDMVEIEISVLSPFHRIASIDEIEVGIHGLMVRKGIFSGLLLPQVATEYGWNREQFLSHTCEKAGLSAAAWKHEGIEIEIFSAVVFGERELGRPSG